MGHYEDLFYEITESVNKHGVKLEFEKQLEKMRNQGKHKYMEVRDRWTYAHAKVLKNKNK